MLELHGNELVALLFEPINDLTREAALHAVRLDPEKKKTRTGERERGEKETEETNGRGKESVERQRARETEEPRKVLNT